MRFACARPGLAVRHRAIGSLGFAETRPKLGTLKFLPQKPCTRTKGPILRSRRRNYRHDLYRFFQSHHIKEKSKKILYSVCVVSFQACADTNAFRLNQPNYLAKASCPDKLIAEARGKTN